MVDHSHDSPSNWTGTVSISGLIVYSSYLVAAPFVGVVLARVTGPLTRARGVIGAMTVPAGLVGAELLLAWVHGNARTLYGMPLVSAALWIVESACIGAATTAIWRAADRRRGVVRLTAFDRR